MLHVAQSALALKIQPKSASIIETPSRQADLAADQTKEDKRERKKKGERRGKKQTTGGSFFLFFFGGGSSLPGTLKGL